MATLAAAPSTPVVVRRLADRSHTRLLCLLLLFWLAIFVASLATPPLLDDADATHAQAAQAMLRTGDWVTLHVDGIRYLEKAPLPYWIAALSLRLFGQNALAIHLPLALAVLGLAALGYRWAARSFDIQTAFYTALFVLTSVGPFLFTRIFIPDALLSLLLACGLYSFHCAIELPSHPAAAVTRDRHPSRSGGPAFPPPRHSPNRTSASQATYALLFWLSIALAVLTKGLIAIVFLLGTAALYFTLTRTWHRWRLLRPFAGCLLFLAVAAPWHLLAGLRNTHGTNGHGFFWFYFMNEHVLRFLGRRVPRDYNKLPAMLYWALHLVWLFPWSFFAPVAAVLLWRKRRSLFATQTRAQRTFVLLASFSALVLVFFSLSTNQEYYTFPVYLPLLMLLAASLRRAQANTASMQGVILSGAKDLRSSAAATPSPLGTQDAVPDRTLINALRVSYAALALTGLLLALALTYGVWQAHRLPFTPDIGTLLDRRGIGSYTLSLSHFFDLTGASFAALRLPATLAAVVLCAGPSAAFLLHRKGAGNAAVLTLATASGLFLIAAHIALCRFAPMLSSSIFASTILRLEHDRRIPPHTQVLLFGDQAFGSSIPFYLHRNVQLVDGRSSSMLFGSTFTDTPPIFVSSEELAASWGHGPRKLLFVPAEQREAVARLLGTQPILLIQSSGKELLTDRPLDDPRPSATVISTEAHPFSLSSRPEAAGRSGETPVFAPAHPQSSKNTPAR